uniref:Uncharacterized protein n=1 Tax=Anopheles merus TaxID=30066 RepID=A0A182UPR8_ANOME
MFENFEQLSGFEETLFALRVRKYNRTMSVLNGSIIIPHPINDTTEVVVLQSSLPYFRQHAVGVKLSIDSFEQTLGQDILWMDLRVRKYNRTSTVINGTIHMYQEGINDYKSAVGKGTSIMLKVTLYTLCILSATESLKVVFENFKQLTGHDIVECDIRVRKFNRTMTVLNGSFVVQTWLNDSIELSVDLFHSRLGNQQFNHYPMKLPSCGCCSFFDNLQTNYGKQTKSITNLPAIGECPISPRTVDMIDFAFPQEVVSQVMPRGLWKALVTARLNGKYKVDMFYSRLGNQQYNHLPMKLPSSVGVSLSIDSFEQTLGQDIMEMDLRVRKFNRTSTVINGTIHLRQEATNALQFNLDIFYSRLGNQQFNHMPLKLPTAGACDFVDNLKRNYPEHIRNVFNLPEIGECPISPRDVYILDAEFPNEAIPPAIAKEGLWKAVMRCFVKGKERVTYAITLKGS